MTDDSCPFCQQKLPEVDQCDFCDKPSTGGFLAFRSGLPITVSSCEDHGEAAAKHFLTQMT